MEETQIKKTNWRCLDDNTYILTKNNQYKLPQLKDNNEKKEKSQNRSKFYYDNRKTETKGSSVHTPDGYGTIQSFEGNIIQVKVKNQLKEYNNMEVITDIPIQVRVITQDQYRDEYILLPLFTTTKTLNDKIDELIGENLLFGSKIFFQGKPLIPSDETLERIGIGPQSKMLAISTMKNPYKINRFSNTSYGWGFYDTIDSISFYADKVIQIVGFGLYKPDSKSQEIQARIKFVQGKDVGGPELYSDEVLLRRESDDIDEKIQQFIFKKAVKIQSYEIYTCVMECSTGSVFYGSGGKPTIKENGVTIQFESSIGGTNGSQLESGQFPELLFF